METDKMNRKWFIDENLTNARPPQSKGCSWWKRLNKWFRGIPASPHFNLRFSSTPFHNSRFGVSFLSFFQQHAFSSTTLSEIEFDVVGKVQELLQTCHE
jgi:hypothetical protein